MYWIKWSYEFIWVSEVLSSVDGFVAEFFFDSEDLIVFGQSFRSAWSTSFDLSSSQTNNQISNECILSLSWPVRHHHTPSIINTLLSSLNRFSQASNLVDLQQEGIARLLLDGSLDSLFVGDEEVIADDLYLGAEAFGDEIPSFPVVLIEGIFNWDDGIFGCVLLIDSVELLVGYMRHWLGQLLILEVQIILLRWLIPELTGCTVHTNLDNRSMSSSANSLLQ